MLTGVITCVESEFPSSTTPPVVFSFLDFISNAMLPSHYPPDHEDADTWTDICSATAKVFAIIMTMWFSTLNAAHHSHTYESLEHQQAGSKKGQAIDAPLSEIGQQQAEAAGRYLKNVRFSNVFVSDMLRAQQTAETIVKQNSSCSGLQMVCEPLLKEKCFGISEGRPVQELVEMAKAAGQSFPGFTPPEGETQEQVKERVKKFLEKMLQQIGSEHWLESEEKATSSSAPPQMSPVEGKPDDGVRDVSVHALVVTHGAYMTVAVRYLVEELHCPLPQGSDKKHMFSLSPNTGLCRFLLTMEKREHGFKLSGVHCVFVHRGDHVTQ
ncbi:uncharacterized protein V6R79_007670 [Siganus canaliculatus]